MQTSKRMLAAVTAALLALCAASTRDADAAPHRPRAAKHATAKPAKTKRPAAARHAKAAGAAARRSADEPADEPAPEPAKVEAKVDHAPPKPAMQGAAVSQAEDSEEPPVRQRAK